MEMAAIVVAGCCVGLTMTEMKNGEICCYGELLDNDTLHQIGRGKISRNQKWLTDDALVYAERYSVNQGGGGAI